MCPLTHTHIFYFRLENRRNKGKETLRVSSALKYEDRMMKIREDIFKCLEKLLKNANEWLHSKLQGQTITISVFAANSILVKHYKRRETVSKLLLLF